MKRRVPYGVANYEEIVADNGYFVDKTSYIPLLESVKNPIFLRPRRFGKSLWCRIIECYYSVRLKDRFDELFGHTWIGKNPTPLRNACLVLHLDFSIIEVGRDLKIIERSFNRICNRKMESLMKAYKEWFKEIPSVQSEQAASDTLNFILQHVEDNSLPPLYVIIDEYDNFANQLITSRQDHIYRQLTADDSFLKTFFKALKEGRKTGTIANVFITGVLPITMDELASGFNIARFITLDEDFEAMLGFTQTEVDHLLDAVYEDYDIPPSTRSVVDSILRIHYNGYHFVNPAGEPLYNPTLILNFLFDFCRYKKIPEFLTDLNLRTDLSWVRRITSAYEGSTEEFVDHLMLHDSIRYSRDLLTSKFDMSQFFDKDFFPISFFYLGMLTIRDGFTMELPNLNMRKIFTEYFNELHHIDMSSRYADIMQSFLDKPDMAALFAGYWKEYVSQLPEAVFRQVNENFYRTTFFELCSSFLSRWLGFTVERSYPQGRSDLEFIGKYHEKFAGMRWVIEFKYFSNAELQRMKTTIEDFTLRPEDTEQLVGYVEGLRREYPEARIFQHVIYCFGNQGYRVFEIK